MSGSCLSPRDPVGLLRASGEEGGRGIAREISHVETESIIGKCELGWRSSRAARVVSSPNLVKSDTEPSRDSTRVT